MTSENVSSNPLEPASPVDDPEITEIIDLKTGNVLDVKSFIAGQRYDAFIELRGRIREHLDTERCMYACALCGTPAYVVAKQKNKNFFFRHITEDGSCRARTRGNLSQDEIRARKYHGQRESDAHKRIKALIEKSLAGDPSFHTILQEKVWRAARDPKSRRQPDVQAVSEKLGRIAFEVQLSTTFLNVVVERRAFYRQEGGLLVWVLGHFLPEYRRLMIDDLLFSNNSNIFIVDDETARISQERKAFHIRCCFRRPFRNGGEIIDQWQERVVAFSEVTCNTEAQTAYFFDYAEEERRLRETIAVETARTLSQIEDELRQEFFSLLQAQWSFSEADAVIKTRWAMLVTTLAARNIEIPKESPASNSAFRALMWGILSARAGAPVGWNFDTLIQVANRIFDGHKTHLLAFGFAIQHFQREDMLQEQDKHGKWAKRRATIKLAIQKLDPDYLPDTRWLPATIFLFPEIGDRIQKFERRAQQALQNGPKNRTNA